MFVLTAAREGLDVLALVFGRVSRVITDIAEAEDAAVDIATKFVTRSGPAWLLRADDEVRLNVLTVQAVLAHRS